MLAQDARPVRVQLTQVSPAMVGTVREISADTVRDGAHPARVGGSIAAVMRLSWKERVS